MSLRHCLAEPAEVLESAFTDLDCVDPAVDALSKASAAVGSATSGNDNVRAAGLARDRCTAPPIASAGLQSAIFDEFNTSDAAQEVAKD